MAQTTTLIPLAARTSTLIVDSDLDMGTYDLTANSVFTEWLEVNDIESDSGTLNIHSHVDVGNKVLGNINSIGILREEELLTLTEAGRDTDIWYSSDAPVEHQQVGSIWKTVKEFKNIPTSLKGGSRLGLTATLRPSPTHEGYTSRLKCFLNGVEQTPELVYVGGSFAPVSKIWEVDAADGDVYRFDALCDMNGGKYIVGEFRILAVKVVVARFKEIAV